jgi:glutamine cyclotransferase
MSKTKKNDSRTSSSGETPLPRPRPPAWRSRIWLIATFFALTVGGAYLVTTMTTSSGVPTFGFKVANKYPHDSSAFTEGLLYHGGQIYESTGLEGESTLRKFDLAKGQWTIEKLDPKLFGEGLTLWRDRLIHLTYRSGVAQCYDLDLKPLETRFSYEGEGWGLTHDGRHLIMSNGTSELQFRDPETFQLDHRLRVTLGGRSFGRLNELEYVDGRLYANVWHQDYLVEIDPETGAIRSRIDLSGVLSAADRPRHPEAVLNGIAYNSDTGRLIVTGKYWPYLFEIEIVPRNQK